MAQFACQLSDQVILTSDNPRSEDPKKIINEMKAGLNASQMRKVLSLEDRREAIKLGVTLCSEGDILLIAGKGHEKYQEINGERFPFDDMQFKKSILNTKICCITYLHTYKKLSIFQVLACFNIFRLGQLWR